MKRFAIILFIIVSFSLVGQNKSDDTTHLPKRNTIYLELGGNGIFGSLGYDRLFRLNKKIKTSFSFGVSIFGDFKSTEYDEYYGIPLSFNFLFGKKKHHLELGIGIAVFAEVYLTYNDPSNAIYVTQTSWGNTSSYPITPNTIKPFYSNQTDIVTYITPKIGYRFQKPNGGFFFKVAFTPFINFVNRYAGVKKNGIRYEPSSFDWFIGGLDIMNSDMPWAGISLGYTLK